MKVITIMNTNRKHLITNDDLQKANELNDFFLRFETQDFSLECNNVLETISTTDLQVGSGPYKTQSLFRHTVHAQRNPQAQMASLLFS